jgi:eukaryotic-like serine/threonine-protein kinase
VKPAETANLIGFVLDDRYEIVREIGRGGMGVVYEAQHVELAKRVAVKVLLDKYQDDDEAVIRFKREAMAASRIGSPHIIDVQHIGAAPDGRPYVAMELLEGESLANLMKRTGPMEPLRALHIIRQVLRATGAAHAKGIVHRDLKPDNIFIVNRDDVQDFVKLLDFGISKFLETSDYSIKTKLTTTGAVMGTPLYMAPEQAMGAPVAPSVDIYACGVILFEMLAGRPPFNDGNYNMIVAKLLTAPPPRLDDLRKKLPKPLVAAVHRSLEKDPAARYATAEAFAHALPQQERAISQLELATTLPPERGARLSIPPPIAAATATTKNIRDRPMLKWIAGGMALLAGAAIGAALIVRGGNVETPKPTPTPTPTPTPDPPKPAASPATTGTLEIKTIPTNASVRIDNGEAGTTPLEVTVTPGRHRLHLELAGYTGIEADQDVRIGERTSATFTMLPVPTSPTAPPVKPVPPVIVKRPVAPPVQPGSAAPVNPYDEPSAPPAIADPFAKPNPYTR